MLGNQVGREGEGKRKKRDGGRVEEEETWTLGSTSTRDAGLRGGRFGFDYLKPAGRWICQWKELQTREVFRARRTAVLTCQENLEIEMEGSVRVDICYTSKEQASLSKWSRKPRAR